MQPPQPDMVAIAKALCEVTQKLVEVVNQVIVSQEPEIDIGFIPTPFQRGILAALKNKAMKTEDLGRAVRDRRRLFDHPGGLKELRAEGLVDHNKRLGYYRPDAPPPELTEFKAKPGS